MRGIDFDILCKRLSPLMSILKQSQCFDPLYLLLFLLLPRAVPIAQQYSEKKQLLTVREQKILELSTDNYELREANSSLEE